MSSTLLWAGVLTLHLLCVSYWFGGAVYCTQMPRITRALDALPAFSVQTQAYGRYLRGLWHVVPLALLSGGALVWRLMTQTGGHMSWPYHVMALCGLLMTLLFGWMVFGVYNKIKRALRPQPALFAKLHRLAIFTSLLGTIAMACGAAGTCGY